MSSKEKRESHLDSFASYAEYLYHFFRSGASIQDSYIPAPYKDMFSGTLLQWGGPMRMQNPCFVSLSTAKVSLAPLFYSIVSSRGSSLGLP